MKTMAINGGWNSGTRMKVVVFPRALSILGVPQPQKLQPTVAQKNQHHRNLLGALVI